MVHVMASLMSRTSLPGLQSSDAKFPVLAENYVRIQSYRNWPKNTGISVKSLVESGFFYSGIDDQVQCFYCGGIVNNWSTDDVVDEEHFRLMPHCDFISKKLDRSQPKHKQKQEERNVVYDDRSGKDAMSAAYGHDVPASLLRERHSLPPDSHQSVTVMRKYDVAPRDIRARLDTEMSQKLIQMGFKKILLAQVIGERLAETGDDFPSFMDYFKAVKLAESVLCKDSDVLNDYYHKTMEPVQKPAAAAAAPPPAPEPVPAPSVPSPSSAGSGASDDSFKRKKECKICMDKEADTVFMPCRHMCACETCSRRLKKCPLCRKPIQQCIKVYS